MAPVRKVIERLLNLLAFLLTTSRPVTADEIRRRVAGYGGSSDEAFRRMFERDKDLLRRIGIPLELSEGNGWGIEAGYLIDPDAYRLPDPGLTDEERTALSLSSRVVRLGGSPAAPEALLKLGGVGPGGASEPLGADLGVAADQLGELFAAVTERRKIEFDYHQRRRILAPYGLAHRRGHWYLVGGAGDGEAAPDGPTTHPDTRVFRVDRMSNLELTGESDAFRRPEEFDLRGMIDAEPWEAGPDATILATVEFDPEIAWWAARMLKLDHPGGNLTVELPVANVDAFIGWILSFDDAAVVTEPPELRRQVVERIQAAMT